MKILTSIQNSKYYGTIKRFFIIFKIFTFILIDVKVSTGQTVKAISIDNLNQSQDNTIKVNTLNSLCWSNHITNPSKAAEYGQAAITISKKIRYNTGLVASYINMGFTNIYINNLDEAGKCFSNAIKSLENTTKTKKSKVMIAKVFEGIGLLNLAKNDLGKAVDCFKTALKLHNENNIRLNENICYRIIGTLYEKMGNKSLANDYFYKELKNTLKTDLNKETASTYTDFRTIMSPLYSQLNQTN